MSHVDSSNHLQVNTFVNTFSNVFVNIFGKAPHRDALDALDALDIPGS